ncbi:MAG TPA: NACHT domain-containing protein [Micromonosporaceae bacterium]|nr:NACHT domain-containing protein [Micromonosporaceae bacterium]
MTTLLLLPIAVNLASNTIPEWSQRWLWLSWPAVLLLTGAVILVDRQGRPWRRGRVGETGTHIVDETGLDAACDALRVAVDAQWAEEAAMRGLHRAGRLRVRWTTAVGSLAADPAGVLGDESLAGRPFRLRAHGEVRDLAASFRRLPNRQLVVLGAPGSGKTVLALLLTRALVAAARPGEPVPVLFSLASWRPDAEHLRSWLARRLKEEYLFLDNDEQYGLAAAERLVTAGRILPILDGLDELPVALHATAVQALDLGSAERPLVVTSRFEQYRAAASGHLLSRAMVILLQPLSLDDI